MSRMLAALRRLEAAELLVAPTAPAVVEVDTDEATKLTVDASDVSVAAEVEGESAENDVVAAARQHATSPTRPIALDELPFEPVFSPLDSWEDETDSYASTRYAEYDFDWDEAAVADTPVAPAPEPTLAESLASQVLAKIERAKQLADEAGQEEPPVAAGGSPAAWWAGEPPAPRMPAAPTGLCPQCVDQLVELAEQAYTTESIDETEGEKVASHSSAVDSDEVSEPPAAFAWEDLFPDVAIDEDAAAEISSPPGEEVASARRVAEPLVTPIVDSSYSGEAEDDLGAEVSDEVEVELDGATDIPQIDAGDDAEEAATATREDSESPSLNESTAEQPEQDSDVSVPVLRTEHSVPNADAELEVERPEAPSEPSREPPADLSTQYSVLSTDVAPEAESNTPYSSPSSESDANELDSESDTEVASPAVGVPAASGAERAALADLDDPVLAKQFAELGQRVMSDLGKTTHPSAALVGAEYQPHVTDVTLRTALSLALAGRQVLLVDAALADKHLTSGLGLTAEFGLSETLKGRVPWQQAVRATATPGLCVLPAGRITPPTLADGDKRLEGLLKELASQWELVLIDTGSCHESSAPPVIKSARNVYLLVRLGETQTDAAAAAIAAIEKTGAKLRGCVATNAFVDSGNLR